MSNADGKTTIYLIRHGVTDFNQARKFQGSSDIPLNEAGRAQAAKLSKRILESDIKVDKVYVSKLIRTRQTIQPLLDDLGIDAEEIDGIEEINAGDMEGVEFNALVEQYPAIMKKYSESPYEVDMPSGETGAEVYKRGSTAFEEIVKEHPGETVLVISHGFLIQLLLGYIKGTPTSEIGYNVHRNTAVTKIEIDSNGNKEVVYEGDDSHLDLESRTGL